ncbi:unnamed protein product [Cyclocybe aegerita]|uniref:Uncharacterized protein n=1 Tax=Cyclocybe aegerita TaxID=1973307 RepID=A0A8S0XPL5_CYCAE|nr:unnamed protein product [Cyclocybe aegerita]
MNLEQALDPASTTPSNEKPMESPLCRRSHLEQFVDYCLDNAALAFDLSSISHLGLQGPNDWGTNHLSRLFPLFWTTLTSLDLCCDSMEEDTNKLSRVIFIVHVDTQASDFEEFRKEIVAQEKH